MFPDAQYYVTVILGSSYHSSIVRGMDFYEFFTEFRSRHNRFPFIASLVPLDKEEFELFLNLFELEDNTDAIYDNGDQDDY